MSQGLARCGVSKTPIASDLPDRQANLRRNLPIACSTLCVKVIEESARREMLPHQAVRSKKRIGLVFPFIRDQVVAWHRCCKAVLLLTTRLAFCTAGRLLWFASAEPFRQMPTK